ncbi:MAG: hypothetical protein U1U88_000259 [Lawsonella clevelandensis]
MLRQFPPSALTHYPGIVHIWQGVENYPLDRGPSVVTIGVFDGLHRGHARLATAAAHYAEKHGITSLMLSFHPHPSSVVGKGIAPSVFPHSNSVPNWRMKSGSMSLSSSALPRNVLARLPQIL